MAGEGTTVLVVCDHASRRARYERWLDGHAIETVAEADGAIDRLGPTVDVVLVDREAGPPSSLAVARQLVAADGDFSLLLAAPNGLDLAGEPIDGVLPAPVGESDLLAAIEAARSRRSYAAAMTEFYAFTVALASVEAEAGDGQPADDEAYRRLQWLAAEKRVAADAALERTAPDWTSAFESLPDRTDDPSDFPTA